jgi:hypothetical protein
MIASRAGLAWRGPGQGPKPAAESPKWSRKHNLGAASVCRGRDRPDRQVHAPVGRRVSEARDSRVLDDMAASPDGDRDDEENLVIIARTKKTIGSDRELRD